MSLAFSLVIAAVSPRSLAILRSDKKTLLHVFAFQKESKGLMPCAFSILPILFLSHTVKSLKKQSQMITKGQYQCRFAMLTNLMI